MQSDICDTVEDLAKQVIDTDETRKDRTLRLGTFAQFAQVVTFSGDPAPKCSHHEGSSQYTSFQ